MTLKIDRAFLQASASAQRGEYVFQAELVPATFRERVPGLSSRQTRLDAKLRRASGRGDLHKVQKYIALGAHPEAQAPDTGTTAFHEAARRDHGRVITALAQAIGDASLIDTRTLQAPTPTPLHVATVLNNQNALAALLRANADPGLPLGSVPDTAPPLLRSMAEQTAGDMAVTLVAETMCRRNWLREQPLPTSQEVVTTRLVSMLAQPDLVSMLAQPEWEEPPPPYQQEDDGGLPEGVLPAGSLHAVPPTNANEPPPPSYTSSVTGVPGRLRGRHSPVDPPMRPEDLLEPVDPVTIGAMLLERRGEPPPYDTNEFADRVPMTEGLVARRDTASSRPRRNRQPARPVPRGAT